MSSDHEKQDEVIAAIVGSVRKKSESGEAPTQLRCSFCNKTEDAVAKLVTGPAVCICDECVEVCHHIVAEDLKREASKESVDDQRGRSIAPGTQLLMVEDV
jgi:hypothetical protein